MKQQLPSIDKLVMPNNALASNTLIYANVELVTHNVLENENPPLTNVVVTPSLRVVGTLGRHTICLIKSIC